MPITFIGGEVRKYNNLTMIIGFSRLPHGFDLLEGNDHVMDNLHVHELEMSSALVGPFMQGSSHYPPSL